MQLYIYIYIYIIAVHCRNGYAKFDFDEYLLDFIDLKLSKFILMNMRKIFTVESLKK